MKVGICSLGCKVNIYESELVTNILKNNNYEIVILKIRLIFILLILVVLLMRVIRNLER